LERKNLVALVIPKAIDSLKTRRLFSAALCCAALFLPGKGNAAQDAQKNVAGAREGAVAIADSEFGNFTASLAIDGKSMKLEM
jgi:hypothetical protein